MKVISCIIWIIGIVLAKGFWSVFFAIIFPLWAWYLVAERIVERFM